VEEEEEGERREDELPKIPLGNSATAVTLPFVGNLAEEGRGAEREEGRGEEEGREKEEETRGREGA
jgi:hypothetical protein